MNTYQVQRVLLFGDTHGLPQLLRAVPLELVAGFSCASIRSQYHVELEELAAKSSLPLLVQPTAASPLYPSFVEDVRRLRPELILVNSYSMLLREDVLSIPQYGAINIHGALLPQYRGCNPIQWALLNDETETGVTMHYMSKEFDTGDIIAQRKVPISFNDTWRDVQCKIGDATDAMLKEEMPRVFSLTNSRRKQDQDMAKYFKRRYPDDGLIDWGKDSVRHVYNLVRALVDPHPGAFFFRDSAKIVLNKLLTLHEIAALKFGEQGRQRLGTERVQLIPVTKGDASRIACAVSMLGSDALITSGFHDFVDEWNSSLFQYSGSVGFSIHVVQSGQMVGACGLNAIDMLSGSADLEISYQRVSELTSWNDDEVIWLVLRVAFDELGLKLVSIRMKNVDTRIVGLLRKQGFILGNGSSENEQCSITSQEAWRERCY